MCIRDRTYIAKIIPSFHHKKVFASLMVYYMNTDKYVMNDIMYLGNKMFLSQSVNARHSWSTGGNFNLRVGDFAGFGANISLGVNHYEAAGATWSHHLTSFDAYFYVWWNRGPFTISYGRNIPGKYLSGNYVGKNENDDALSFEYKPDKHWTFGIDWFYMFDKKGTRYPGWSYSDVNPYHSDRYIEENGNMVTLSVTYTGDFGTLFRTSRRSLNNSDTGSSLLKL